ncbi:MAG: hypothetical protein AAGD14_11520 [Planctomycetota bacterium]
MLRFTLLLAATLVACGSPGRNDGGNPMNESAGETAMTADAGKTQDATYDLPGYAVYGEDGRLWVFRDGSQAHESFLEKGEPAKRVTLVAAGPDGKTLYGSDTQVLKGYTDAYAYRLPGFAVFGTEERLWVFKLGSKDLEEYLTKGEPAKRVTLVGAGPDGKTLYGSEKEEMESYAKSMQYRTHGFAVIEDDGRLWVFRTGSEGLASYLEKGEPAKRVSLIGIGPDGTTLYGDDKEHMHDFANTWKHRREGFIVVGDEGRLWVFREGSRHYDDFVASGEPAKSVTRVGAGPDGLTVRGAEEAVVEDFVAPHLYAQPGFIVVSDDGRLWIFRRGSSNYQMFRAKGEPAKRVTRVGAGPNGKTIMAVDQEVLDDFMAGEKYGSAGFVVIGDEGRLWVFKAGSKSYAEFLEHGEPAKRVTLVGQGPDGKTLFGADIADLRAYIASAPIQ